MLRHLNNGIRTTVEWPRNWTHARRSYWEFMAILKGKACMVVHGERERRFLAGRLYVTPTGASHAWGVREGQSCEVAVLHFDKLPPGMQMFLPDEATFSMPLSQEQIERIREIYDEVAPHFFKPRIESELWHDRALLGLCAIILGNGVPATGRSAGFDRDAERVQLALDYFRSHLGQHVAVHEVCAALHISPPQLRRIFKKVLKESPKQACTRIALEEACRMALETGMALKEIACLCGFAGFTQFYRVFRQQFKTAPDAWRKRQKAEMVKA